METEPLAPPEAAFPDLAGRETASVMMEELSSLPAKYRTPLVLRYLEGRSRREIADQTDSTIAAVQGQLARGKAVLRGRLLRRGVSLSAAMAVVAGGGAAQASGQMTEGVPAPLIAQTTSNATAIATGGSVAASTAVVLLYREGVRAMFFAEVMKPVAVVTMALLLASGMAIGAGDVDQPAVVGQALTLDATPAIAPIAKVTAIQIEKPQAEVDSVAADDVPVRADAHVNPVDGNFVVAFPGTGGESNAGDLEDAEPNAKGNAEFTDVISIKTWERNASGQAVDWQTGDFLTDTELEKRIREFYAYSPQTVGLGSPLIEAELRFWSWSVRSQHLRRAVANLQKQFENREIEVTDEQRRRLDELQSEADLALANEIKYERELRRQLTADQPDEATNSTPTPEPASRPTPLNGTDKEYWPSGEKKSVRQYREGRVVAASEYAEDGQVLYQMQDNSKASVLRAAKDNATQPSPNEFRLAPSDRLTVAIWDSEGENVLSGEYGVNKSGRLDLATYGDVRAAGRTLAELQQDLLQDARRRLNKPALQVRLIHERFGAVGGNDEPTPEGKQPAQASAPPEEETNKP